MFGWLAAVCLYWILLGCLNVWMAGSRMPLLDIGVLNYWLYIEIVLLYSELILKRDYLHSLQSPRGPAGNGDGDQIGPVKHFGDGAGNGFRGSGRGRGSLPRPLPAPLPPWYATWYIFQNNINHKRGPYMLKLYSFFCSGLRTLVFIYFWTSQIVNWS